MLKLSLARLLSTSLVFAGFACAIVACGGSGSGNVVPAQAPVPADTKASSASVTPAASTPPFNIVQSAQGYGNVTPTLTLQFPNAPVTGDVLVLFVEYNVSIPADSTTSGWVQDASSNVFTKVFHHVVGQGESGSYTINIGGPGGWAEGYIAAEVSGVSTASPVNNTAMTTVPAGTTSFALNAAPKSAGTLPLAFLSAHQTNLQWSSITAGWTVVVQNHEYTEELAQGPVQSGSAPFSAAATLAAPSSYPGAADVVMLNPASTSASTPAPVATGAVQATATPSPASTAASTPAPTPAATSSASSPYVLYGCHVYTANDWFTTNLKTGGSAYASNTVDPNSAAILSNFNSAYANPQFNVNGVTASIATNAIVNRVTNATALYTIGGLSWGFSNDPYNDDPSPYKIPWSASFAHGAGDHNIVLNTDKCLDYELYGASWTGSAISADDGYVHNLTHPFNAQYSTDGGAITKSGLPMLGTLDVGEDAAATSINHIAYMLIPGSDASSIASGGYVAPATAGVTCVSSCTHELPLGARLRLNAGKYTCPSASSYPQANKICVQLETYGAIVGDHDGVNTYQIRLAETSSGTNPWNPNDVDVLNGIPITDWDVMTLGTIH